MKLNTHVKKNNTSFININYLYKMKCLESNNTFDS